MSLPSEELREGLAAYRQGKLRQVPNQVAHITTQYGEPIIVTIEGDSAILSIAGTQIALAESEAKLVSSALESARSDLRLAAIRSRRQFT